MLSSFASVQKRTNAVPFSATVHTRCISILYILMNFIMFRVSVLKYVIHNSLLHISICESICGETLTKCVVCEQTPYDCVFECDMPISYLYFAEKKSPE